MIEKQEADEFDEADDELLDSEESESVDLLHLTRELEQSRRRGAKQGVPALRKLELLAEQRRTAELLSDFDDYEIDEPKFSRRRSVG